VLAAGPWGIVAVAVAAFAALVIAKWDEIKAAGTTVWTVVKDAAIAAWTDIGKVIEGVGSIILSVIDKIISAIQYARELASTPTADPNLPDVRGEGFASGGYVRGRGTATSDSIPAWLSNGEFVIRAGAVKKYGRNLLAALNAGMLKLPKFASGGPVQMTNFKLGLPRFAGGGMVAAPAGGGMVPANIHFGGETYAVQTSEDVLQRMGRAAVRAKMTSGGRKPGWYGS
jgi:hypothetical protein